MQTKSNLRTLLVDADIVAYTSASRQQTSVDWDGSGDTASSSSLEAIQEDIKSYLTSLQASLLADRLILCLSCGGGRYFRHDIWPSYKGNRKGPKPLYMAETKDWLHEEYKAKSKPLLEADDVLGLLGTHPSLIKGEKIIVSTDKDLNQIPGKHFNPRKADLGITEVSPDEADYFFYYQTLTGDSTDGYPGCPGVGPKKAQRLLEDVEGSALEYFKGEEFQPGLLGWWWKETVAVYGSKGKSEEDALTQARVARILRHTDWDSEKQEVRLWNPPE